MSRLSWQSLQGWVFSATAMIVAAFSVFLPRLSPQTELVVTAALIVVLGVPHGALDTAFARKLYGIGSWQSWLGFTVIYFLPAVLVVSIWQLAPLVFLLGFLLVSMAHFSGDPQEGSPLVTRIVYGGAIIIMPLALHSGEVAHLFAILVGDEAGQQVVNYLSVLAWPWVGLMVLLASYSLRTNVLSSIEFGSLTLLAVVAPPLISFTVFFCVMHSARHILRTSEFMTEISSRRLLISAVAPMLITLGLGAIAWVALGQSTLDARLVQLVFVGLAALTVPHMLIVERVRFGGWGRSVNETHH